jgi:hypothetical protein
LFNVKFSEECLMYVGQNKGISFYNNKQHSMHVGCFKNKVNHNGYIKNIQREFVVTKDSAINDVLNVVLRVSKIKVNKTKCQ